MDNGLKIQFDSQSPALNLLKVTTAQKGSATISVVAPARVVACISKAQNSNDKVILFESSDVTSLYSLYKQNKINLLKSQKNLERVKDMFNNNTAVAKDVSDAESDLANSQASLSEIEGKLRILGYNPIYLEKAPIHTVWLICDVLESQIKDVDKGESVPIIFSSFPDKKFYGKAESIGDVVDPQTRTIKVRVSLINPGDKLIPGMFAKVDFGDPIKDVILLPQSAIITVDSNDYVFAKTSENTFERIKVITGFSSDQNVVVLHGVNAGEHIVTDGAMLLKGLSFGF
jgi:multidrug efflux pump subunit AcrA (membrane-fusion protein)